MRKIFLTVPATFVLLLMLYGCGTGSKAMKKDYSTLTHECVQIDIRYIDKNKLPREFGNRNNPYAWNPNGPAITFEVVGKTSDDVIYTIDMYEVILESERGHRGP
jgi:hypothetical protein